MHKKSQQNFILFVWVVTGYQQSSSAQGWRKNPKGPPNQSKTSMHEEMYGQKKEKKNLSVLVEVIVAGRITIPTGEERAAEKIQ